MNEHIEAWLRAVGVPGASDAQIAELGDQLRRLFDSQVDLLYQSEHGDCGTSDEAEDRWRNSSDCVKATLTQMGVRGRHVDALLEPDVVSAEARVRSALRYALWEQLEQLTSDAVRHTSPELCPLLPDIDSAVSALEGCLM